MTFDTNLVVVGDWALPDLAKEINAANCTVAPRTAQAYMRLVKKLDQLPAPEAQRVADLPLREAMRAIATDPAAPARQRDSVLKPRTSGEAQRMAQVLSTAGTALDRAAKDLQWKARVSGKRMLELRAKLQDALAALDHLAAEAT